MAPFRTFVLLLLIAGFVASTAACGRKGSPERLPEDEPRKEYPTK